MEEMQRSSGLDRQDYSLMQWEIYSEIDRQMVELEPIGEIVVALERLRRLKRAQKEVDLLGVVFRRALARSIIEREDLW